MFTFAVTYGDEANSQCNYSYECSYESNNHYNQPQRDGQVCIEETRSMCKLAQGTNIRIFSYTHEYNYIHSLTISCL